MQLPDVHGLQFPLQNLLHGLSQGVPEDLLSHHGEFVVGFICGLALLVLVFTLRRRLMLLMMVGGALVFFMVYAGISSAADTAVVSEDLGRVGPEWPIAEEDMLDAILKRAKHAEESGEAGKLESQMHDRAMAYSATPPSLGLPRAGANRSSLFDPSIIVPYDIKDANGRVLFPAGTTVNPLQHHSFDETLLLVDASDADQVAWLKQRLEADHAITDKVVLTGGSPGQLSDVLGKQVYFDQNRTLVQKFGIDAVPASVVADPAAPSQRLVIQEYDPRAR